MFPDADDVRDRPKALDVVQSFLLLSSYDHAFAIEMIALAKDSDSAWPLRRVAVLMLEYLVLKLDPDDAAERDFLLTAIAVKRPGQGDKVNDSVLLEGFTSTEPGRFFAELRQRLLRLRRIHDRIKGTRTSAAALRDFIFTSSKDCKLSLARYLWTPQEVARNIQQQVRGSNALSDPSAFQEKLVDEESRTAFSNLPPFERKLVDHLFDSTRAFWVDESTPSELNSLVEYPINTVVLVIKPPGSDVEIEIKRAGVRGPNPLTALYSRNGGVVPPSHHLYGGSMGHLLHWEARHGSLLSRIYRAVHGTEASMARILSINFIYGVPVGGGEKHILEYFSESDVFGRGFEDMKADMRRAARALRSSGDWIPPLSSDGIGLSAHFLGQAAPSQAIVAGSTSFRLDRTAAYLLDKGPGLYFTEGLRRKHTREDARRLADEVLEEVLGSYVPPEQPYSTHRQYVEAALALPVNRERADRNFMSMMRQIGLLWGTILGVRGYSNGESFVARNVGVKSVWQDGQWTARLVFMDQDALYIVGKKTDHFYPSSALPGMINDANHILGSRSGRPCPWKGNVDCLREIYAIDETLQQRGIEALQAALAETYAKTHAMMQSNPIAKTLFTGVFIKRLRDWDHFVATYLDARDSKARVKRWDKQMRTWLAKKNYSDHLVNEYFNAVRKHAAFLSEFAFLFNP